MKTHTCVIPLHQITGLLLAVGILLTAAAGTFGDVLTWDGSESAFWNNPQNWAENRVPADSDYLVFPNTASNRETTNNIAGLEVYILEVTGTGYSFHGNSIGLWESLRLNTTYGMVAHFYMDVELLRDAEIRMMGFNNVLHYYGNIDTASYVLSVGNYGAVYLRGPIGGSGSVIKFGSGTVYMQGSSGNTYAGSTTVDAGTLVLNQASGNAIPRDLIIEDGATVRQETSAEIAYDVTIYGSGTYDMNGHSEAIDDLVLYDGADHDTGIATLSLAGDVIVDGGVSVVNGKLNLLSGDHDFNILYNGLLIWPGAHCYLNADVSGGGNLMKTGPGDMRMSGNNTYSGTTDVQAGDIMIESNTALGSAAGGTTVGSASRIYISAFSQASSKNIVGETLSIGGAIRSYGVANSWAAPITLTDGVEISVASGQSLELNGVMDGPGGVTKTSTGALIYSGASGNTYTGNTDVQDGTLLLNKSSGNGVNAGTLTIGDDAGSAKTVVVREQANIQIATIPVVINSDGWLDVDTYSDTVGAITFNGGYASSTPPGTLYLGGSVTANPSPATPRMDGQVNIGGGSYGRIFEVASTEAMYIGAAVSGAAGITKTGGGHLLLESANTYSGLTTVQAGYLTPMDDLSLGAVANGVVIEGGTLRLSSAVVADESMEANSGTRLEAIGAFSEWDGPVTLNGDIYIWIPNGGETLDISGGIDGPGGFTKSGRGNLILSGHNANSYAGDTRVYEGLLELAAYNVIRNGTLVVGNNDSAQGSDIVRFSSDFPIHSDAATVINSDGRIDFNGNYDDLGPMLFDRGHITTGSGGTLVMNDNLEVIESFETNWAAYVSGNVELPAPRTFEVESGAFFNLTASVDGAGGITKNGPGQLWIQGSNSYANATIINEGKIYVLDDYALGTTNGGTTVNAGAALVLYSHVHVADEALTLSGTGSGVLGALAVIYGQCSWNGPVTLSTSSRMTASQASDELELGGAIGGSGGLALQGDGTCIFSGAAANTYTGDTYVDEGTLLLNKDGANRAIQGNLIIGDGGGGVNGDVVRLERATQIGNSSDVTVGSSGLLDLNSHGEAIDGLSGSGNVTLGSGYLNIGAGNASSVFSGSISGSGNVSKLGSGTLTFSGPNSYTGDTGISSGTLLVNGSQPASDVTVSASGTLGGSGVVGTVDSAGIVAPGASAGTLSVKTTRLDAGSYLELELNDYAPPGYDRLDVTGAIKLSDPNLVVNWGFVPAVGDSFAVIDNDGVDAVAGTFNGLPEGALLTAGNVQLRITYAGGDGNDVILEAAKVAALEPLRISSMTADDVKAVMEWEGGVPFYRIEKRESLTNGIWTAVTAPTRDFIGNVPTDSTNGFYRVTGGH